ncbi:restriction endonuclease subunit S [Nitrospira sp. T9]|uniref:restriction endonuclease subunit S n=1 Tax=unclassified Nitrospira TaxID=2652172 RepID=UPI003F9B63FB
MRKEKLSTLCDVKNGYAFKSRDYVDTGYRVIRITNVQKGVVVDNDPKFISRTIADKSSNLKMKPGDILISLTGNVGRVGRIQEYHLPAVLNQRVGLIRPRSDELDDHFLFQYLNSDNFEKEAINNSFGVAQLNLSSKWVENHKIPLPPLDDQRRIAHLLGMVEGLIARRKQHLQQLDNLLKSVFLEMFGDPVRNEKDWDKKAFRDVTLKFSDGPFGSNLKSSHYQSEGIRVVRLNNIGVWEFNDSDKAYVSQRHYEDVLKKYTCIPGDVLIGTMGDPNIRACLLPESIPIAINKADCVLCRVNPNYLSPYYILGLLNNPGALNLVSNLLHGQTRTRVSMGQLAKLEIAIPPIELQKQFSVIVERVESLKIRYQQSLTDLESLYGALSQKAFKGELDLSRVPLPVETTVEIPYESLQTIATETVFELPKPIDLAALKTPDGRKALMDEWLNAWLENLEDAPFASQEFMEAARQRQWEQAEDDVPEWGLAEYDYIKSWVFEQIQLNKLKQTRNTIYVNGKPKFGNQVFLRTRNPKFL